MSIPATLQPLLPPRSRPARYAVACIIGAASVAIATALGPILYSGLFLVGIGAVAVAADLCGARPALVTAAIFVAGAAAAGPRDGAAAVRIALFAAIALLVARTSRWSRQGLRMLATVRREAARRLRARLEFQRAVAKAVDEGIYALDAAGRITFMNVAAERILGYRARELIGKPMQRALRCSRADAVCGGPDACRVLAVMRTGEPFRAADDLLTRKDGTRVPIRYSSAPIRRGGRTVGAVVAFQDVTVERRSSERERFLAAASEQLASSIDFDETLTRVARLALPFLGDWCMVVLVGEDGVPRRVAVEAHDPALASTVREILERYPIDLEAEHGVGRVLRTGMPELIPCVDDDFAGHSGTTVATRAALLRRIGLRSFLAVPLRARGRLLGVVDFAIAGAERRFGAEELAVAEDLAARCALALDNARLHRKVREAVRAREETLAVVSHDLRTPLGTIRAAAEVVRRSAPPGVEGEPARRASVTIARVGGQMARLVGDLLDLASIDAGRLSMTPGHLAPEEILREAAEAVQALADDAGVRVVAVGRAAPRVEADRERIQQVLVNLLSNAIKVTPRGGEVRVSHLARRGRVVFSVRDAGPGIVREHRARVFDRYWRGGAGYHGTGLGLSIAKSIVEAHGGRIWVARRSSPGATFRFTLPAAEGADAGRASSGRQPARPEGAARPGAGGA
ncbi:MAG TPA: ATP-binding protein [Anaeromyxobacter sp.]